MVSRKYVTPFITLVFLVLSITGILMFFHLFDGYTEVVHEFIGLIFIICALLHIAINWKALKVHLKWGIVIPAILLLAALSLLLMFHQLQHPKVDTILLEKMTNAPLGDAFIVLQVDSLEVVTRMKDNGISMEGAETMKEIWIRNHVSPEKVIYLIVE